MMKSNELKMVWSEMVCIWSLVFSIWVLETVQKFSHSSGFQPDSDAKSPTWSSGASWFCNVQHGSTGSTMKKSEIRSWVPPIGRNHVESCWTHSRGISGRLLIFSASMVTQIPGLIDRWYQWYTRIRSYLLTFSVIPSPNIRQSPNGPIYVQTPKLKPYFPGGLTETH